ncbi:MAG: sensor histidine kinase [Promethearchaeota archaeon]
MNENKNHKLIESKTDYREAYERANLYKELIAHDLNNILQNIYSSLELCTFYVNNPKKSESMIKMLKIINEQVIRGEKLISNVRNLSKLEENEISIKSMDINAALKNAIKYISKSFQERKININIKDTALSKKYNVRANDLLLAMFENVLINAVKYNENPIVEIIIQISKIQKKKTNFVKIEFIDNGIGIIDTRKKKIFQKGCEIYKGAKGMGFGLSLVKKVIECYNGQIWVEDKIKGDFTKGSNFVILIPEGD